MSATDDILRRLDALESESAIRKLMVEYLTARDFEEVKGPHIASLFTEDAVWEGVGSFAEIFGSHHGREAIEQRFSRPFPFSAHLLGNESATVNGDTATGTWVFLLATVFQGQAVWVAGRYQNDFVRVDGQWKFKHVRIHGIFYTPYEDGWVRTPLVSR